MSTTTILGILTILGAIINAAMNFLKGSPIDFGVTFGVIAGGIGLIKAADQKAVDAGVKTSAENRNAINANSRANGIPSLPPVQQP